MSMAGIALSTMAMVCTLSVFNGFREVVEGLYTAFDPQLKVTPVEGKFVDSNDSTLLLLRNHEGVATATNVLEEHALILFEGHPMIVTLKGVDEQFVQTTNIQSILRGDGDALKLKSDEVYYGIPGLALSRYICGTNNFGMLQMCAPKRGNALMWLIQPRVSTWITSILQARCSL